MSFEWLYVIFIVVAVLDYIFLDIKINKIEKERSLDRDKVISSLMAHNQALRKLNTSFKDHERRIDNIEELIAKCISSLPEKEESKEFITCEDCEFYDPSLNLDKRFLCKRFGHIFPDDEGRKVSCSEFEKKEGLDEDENVIYYANNVKVDIQSKAPYVVYKTDGLLPEEYANLVSKLYYSD